MHPSKAPGLDELTVEFYQRMWPVLASQFTKMALDILNNRADPAPRNHTLVTLIPKIDTPRSIKEYCLTSLCNITYKVVARAITNCLRGAFEDIIDQQ